MAQLKKSFKIPNEYSSTKDISTKENKILKKIINDWKFFLNRKKTAIGIKKSKTFCFIKTATVKSKAEIMILLVLLKSK